MPAQKTSVVLLVNVGWQDADRLGLHDSTPEELMEGKTVQVPEAIAKEMIAKKWAADPAEHKKAQTASGRMKASGSQFPAPPTPPQVKEPKTKTTATDDTDVEEEDDEPEPETESEEEKIDRISRMRSPEKLKEIVKNDPRPEVVEAAQIRLEELKG